MEPTQKSFFSKYKFTLISLLVILLAAIPLLLLSNKASKPTAMSPSAAVSPTATPLTTTNAEPTLDATDQQMQQTLNQMDTDVQAASQVDASQDSTTGL